MRVAPLHGWGGIFRVLALHPIRVAKRRHACRRRFTDGVGSSAYWRSIRFESRSDGMLKPGVLRREERTSLKPQVISQIERSVEKSACH
jgi:hypothetical protein